MRALGLISLAGLVLAANLAAGFVRGQADPAGQIVLCTGHGPVMVYVDETGAPAGPPVLCPDGIVALFDIATASPHLPAPDPVVRRLAPLNPPVLGAVFVPVEGKARSPPQTV